MSSHVICTTANAFVDCHIWRIFPMNGSSFNRTNGYALRIYKGNICHFLQIVYFQTLMIPDKVEQTTY